MPSKEPRIRGWAGWTLNNWTEEEYNHITSLDCRYLVVGKEIAPTTGTPHLQGYIEWENGKTWKETCKLLGARVANVEKRKGTPQQAADYCKKDKDFFEKGTIPSQGSRTDLNDIRDQIEAGTTTVEQITLENPMIYHQYGRTLERVEDILNRRKARTWMTEGIWYYGPTGTGKSYNAFQGYDPTTHYVWDPNDNGWWDGYNGQEIVIINEFRGQLPYYKLLDIVDDTPFCGVKRRNRGPQAFLAKKVIITSSLPPHEVYHNLADNDSLEQLERRFKIVHLSERYTEVPKG